MFNPTKRERIAGRVVATITTRFDPSVGKTVPYGVMDDVGTKQVYLSPAFIKEWNTLFTKFSKQSSEARHNISEYYRKGLILIKTGQQKSGPISIKDVYGVPQTNGAKFHECKQVKIDKTGGFCPRIFFVEVPHTNDIIILDIIDKDDNDIPLPIVQALRNKYNAALQNNYKRTYAQN